MYFHAIENQANGFPILEYAKKLGIESSMFFTPPYYVAVKTKHGQVAEVMNMFDALLCVSAAEGFGMPITEIQACGRPAIVTGFRVPSGYHRFSPIGSFIADPDPAEIYKAMELTYKMDKEKTAKACREHILSKYNIIDLVRNKWIPFFEDVEADIYKE
jgi:glycosyltransferase involved in cell wall biosynthesis